jgi:hypothetical protein
MEAVQTNYRYVLTANEDRRAKEALSSPTQPGRDKLLMAIHSLSSHGEYEGAWKCDGLNHVLLTAYHCAEVPAVMTFGKTIGDEVLPGACEIKAQDHQWVTALATDRNGNLVAVDYDAAAGIARISRKTLSASATRERSGASSSGKERSETPTHSAHPSVGVHLYRGTQLQANELLRMNGVRLALALCNVLGWRVDAEQALAEHGLVSLVSQAGRRQAETSEDPQFGVELTANEETFLRESLESEAEKWRAIFSEIDAQLAK